MVLGFIEQTEWEGREHAIDSNRKVLVYRCDSGREEKMVLTRSNIAFLLSMVLSLGCVEVADAVANTEPESLHSRVDLSDKHTGLTILSVQNNTDLFADPLIRTAENSVPWIEYGAYRSNDISVFFKDKLVPSGLIFGFVPPVNTVLMPGVYRGIGNRSDNPQTGPELIIITDAPSDFEVTDNISWNFEILEIELLPNGELFRFAANFSLFSDSTACCQSVTALGQVRFNSTIPRVTIEMTTPTSIPTLSVRSLCVLSFLMVFIGYFTPRLKTKLAS